MVTYCLEAGTQFGFERRRIRNQVFVVDDLERGERCGACDRVAGIGVDVDEWLVLKSLLDSSRYGGRAHRDVANRKPFGHRQDVRSERPSAPQPKSLPVRPKPVTTSSAISRMPYRSHSSRSFGQ